MVFSTQDPRITRANEFIACLSDAAFPGAYYREFFTWMKYLLSSIAKWKYGMEEWFQKDSEVFEGLFLEVQDHVINGEV
ncbi:hypothetical protein J3R30DRAFT_3461532 [Lentinula aciculospora]|uniref:Uncharacterized protein n=1 Tax=Lentinula aciculospora TaxID=153920 RepID=A0A9W9AEC7_9AGAR|nr:hypothetical protein J3R30DRAFT_3461516 [Lentinula aciculospora]KAJ4480832.1 hypothetical protein J3R30DRAFT_3461532 [Lentinula aciculospora]